MIPLGDSEASRRLAPANTLLIVANLAAFAMEVRLAHEAGPILWRLALVPAHITQLNWRVPVVSAEILATLVSAQFLHAGLLHLAGNMLYLFIFGPAVEARMGPGRFLGFYLAAGMVAGLAIVAMAPESRVPVIGASGAIAGALGGYFVLYPGGSVRTVLPARTLLRWAEIPAIFYLLAWFALQLYFGIASAAPGPLAGGVAWWAHVGGFLFGVATAPLIVRVPIIGVRAKGRRARPGKFAQ